MSQRMSQSRSGFTLLEMMLSLAIGAMLMIGLYVALNIQITATRSGRGLVDQAAISEGVLKEIDGDVKQCLATLDYYPTAAQMSYNAQLAAANLAGTTPPTLPVPATTYTYSFNFSVQGDSNWMTIYCSKIPQAIAQAQQDNSNGGTSILQYTDCDVRRVTYFFLSANDGTGGLIRQEVSTTTDPSTTMLPPTSLDDYSKQLAAEVLAITFEYWDGQNWQQKLERAKHVRAGHDRRQWQPGRPRHGTAAVHSHHVERRPPGEC